MVPDTVAGSDGVVRCGWCTADADYMAYHDTEWGRPCHDDVRLFEKLCLEGFQAGLSWLTVLRKRPAFRELFAGFDPALVADFGDPDVLRLLTNDRIIRHRGKIEATIANARAVRAMHQDGQRLDDLVWSYAPASTSPPRTPPHTMAEIPATTAASSALSAALKKRGFRFIGPTTAYAFMQAMGLVNDHLAACDIGAALRLVDQPGSQAPDGQPPHDHSEENERADMA